MTASLSHVKTCSCHDMHANVGLAHVIWHTHYHRHYMCVCMMMCVCMRTCTMMKMPARVATCTRVLLLHSALLTSHIPHTYTWSFCDTTSLYHSMCGMMKMLVCVMTPCYTMKILVSIQSSYAIYIRILYPYPCTIYKSCIQSSYPIYPYPIYSYAIHYISHGRGDEGMRCDFSVLVNGTRVMLACGMISVCSITWHDPCAV